MPEQEQKTIVAVKCLFEAHHAKIYNLCLRMLGHRQEAEDITQDVFVRAFTSYNRFRGEANPGTWLYRIAVNLCLNHQRKQKYRRWLSLDFFLDNPDAPALRSRNERPDERMERAELERMVRDAIEGLPARQRMALVLSRYEGLSYQEIAGAMECSIASVESLLHRAKQNLAKRLRPATKEG